MQSPRIAGLIARQLYIQSYYEANATSPGGHLTHPRELSGEEAQSLLETWETQRKNRNTTVLSGGLDYERDAFSPQESQYAEGARLDIQDVALLFGIPGPLLESQEGTSTTYANRADLAEQYWKQTLYPSFAVLMEERLSQHYGQAVYFDPEQYYMANLWTRSQSTRTLVDAGFEPADAADAAGMPPMEHTGLPPVQVQPQENVNVD